jgi:prolyl 4-hydroxylase
MDESLNNRLKQLGAIRVHNEIEIYKIPNFATQDECDQLIQDAEKVGYQQSEVDSKTKSKTQSRTSTTCFIKDHESNVGVKLGKKAKDLIGDKLEGIQVQRYFKDQKYNPHYDTFEKKDGSDQRSWTLMIYLSDVDEGGGTYFPKIDFRLYPEKGTAVLWNNLDAQKCRENKTLHMGEPVKSGSKYITTYWFRKPNKSESFCNQPESVKFTMNPKIPKSKTIIEQFGDLEVEKKCGICFGFLLLIGLIVFIIIYYS